MNLVTIRSFFYFRLIFDYQFKKKIGLSEIGFRELFFSGGKI